MKNLLGTYGVVYRARDTKTNELVALKRVRMEKEKDGLPMSGGGMLKHVDARKTIFFIF